MPPQITVIPFVVPMIGNAGDALGYGIGAPSGLGVLTPYTGLTLGEGGNRTYYRAGARWNVAPGAALGLEATRQESAAGEPATSAIMLRTQLRW